jgi:hypothetical protein
MATTVPAAEATPATAAKAPPSSEPSMEASIKAASEPKTATNYNVWPIEVGITIIRIIRVTGKNHGSRGVRVGVRNHN